MNSEIISKSNYNCRHSDPSRVFHITGPPGTGKTTYLARQAEHAAEKYGFAKILVASLTRAAAHEFRSRGLHAVPKDQIGTLHAICLHALGDPPLVEKHLGDWRDYLADHSGSTTFALTGGGGPTGMDRNQRKSTGDKIFEKLNVFRALYPGIFREADRLPPHLHVPTSVVAFEQLWTAWKEECGYKDFTDLIEECIEHVEHAPGNPNVLFGDETQDWSRLEILLFRDHWGCHADKTVLVGDMDQAIFTWRGADPRIFLDFPVPESNKIVLKRSYRVPAAVKNYALGWIESKVRTREPVAYKSRPEAGFVGLGPSSYQNPIPLVPLIQKSLEEKGTTMVLASCAYHLRPLLRELRHRGIPYANPYRLEDREWNPLRSGQLLQRKETTRLDRVLAFLRGDPKLRGTQAREWTYDEIAIWLKPLRAAGDDPVLTYGAKARIEKLAKLDKAVGACSFETFGNLFQGGWDGPHAAKAWAFEIDWWVDAMAEKEAERYRYYANIVKAHGARALAEPPRCFVGTIHSVKGGEADTVILYPDLSDAAMKTYGVGQTEEVGRLFYVAMTRARSQLIICPPHGPLHARLPGGLPRATQLLDGGFAMDTPPKAASL